MTSKPGAPGDPAGRRDDRLAEPFFSGGSGRSGTTIVGKLLSRHPQVALNVPVEAKFLTGRYGLCDVVDARLAARHDSLRDWLVSSRLVHGNVSVFERHLRGQWFRQVYGDGVARGLCQGIDRPALDAALRGFRRRLRADPAGAAARLAHDLLDPPAKRLGKPRWIDTTPRNAWRADSLVRIFPDLRIVHMVRDGRDVAASVSTRYWGPDDVDDALGMWETRLMRIGRSLAEVPPSQVLTVQFEDLVVRRRTETVERLLDFLGLEPHGGVRAYLARQMPPARGNVGRWARDLDAGQQRDVTRRYEAALERLAAAGVPVPR